MARAKAFSVEEAQKTAMFLFWNKGYYGTSLQDLTREIGISKSSFYDTLGSKHQLFLSVLSRYLDEMLLIWTRIFETSKPVGQQITDLFDMVVSMALSPDSRGCFVNNTAVELATTFPDVAQLVSRGFNRLERVLRDALEKGVTQREFPKELDCALTARFFVSNINGIIVLSRAPSTRDSLPALGRMAMTVLAK